MRNQTESASPWDSSEIQEEEYTEVIPAQVVSLSNYAKNAPSPSNHVAPVESEPKLSDFEENWALTEDIDEEPTVREDYPIPEPAAADTGRLGRFIHHLLDPYYTPPYPERWKSQIKAMRERIRTSRQKHLQNFPDTYDLRVVRWLRQTFQKMKARLTEQHGYLEIEEAEELTPPTTTNES